MLTPDDPADHAALDRVLNADDPTTYRMWRYRAVGMTMAQAVVAADTTRRSVALHMPGAEHSTLSTIARGHGLTPVRFVRRSVATFLREEGHTRETLPWLMRDGVWG